MRWQRPKLRFSLRLLLLLVALATLPAWWVATKRSEYFSEQRAVQRMRQLSPELTLESNYYGPQWLARCGYMPVWLYRVDSIDPMGLTLPPGRTMTAASFPNGIPVDFDDADFAALHPELKKFAKLRWLYLPFTKVTDRSLPLLREYEQLKFVNLQQTAMTSAEVRKLEQARPDLQVPFFHQHGQQGNRLPGP